MNGIIVYKTKYGSTKRYAEMIKEETNFDIFNIKDLKIEDLKEYNIIIYCAPIFATIIKDLNFIKDNLNELKDKKIYILAVGINSKTDEYIKTLKENNSIENLPFYYVRGAIDIDKLKFFDKMICKLVKNKENQDIGDKSDFVNKENLKELLEDLK